MNYVQIRSECRSGEVKRSWNIRIGHNLEGTHLSLVCMHKIGSMIQLWPKMGLQHIFRQFWVTYVQGLPNMKEHQQVNLAQFWIFGTNAILGLGEVKMVIISQPITPEILIMTQIIVF